MTTIFWWLAQNTLAIVVLIPLAIVVCRLFRRRPAVQHAIWVVLLFRFITPPVVSWPWSIEQVWPSLEPAAAAVMDPAPGARSAFVHDDRFKEPEDPGWKISSNEPSHAIDISQLMRPHSSLPRSGLLARIALWAIGAVWLLGSAGCAIKQSRRIARHAALLRRAAAPPQDLTDEIAAVARLVGLRPPQRW